MPEMKQECDLTPADFQRQPVWIGVRNYDSDEPWYEQADEETYRPWTGPLPFSENRGIALVAATFRLADGSVYPGYCTAVRENWDDVPTPYTTAGGTRVTPQSWSEKHGGAQLSVLALQNPVLFVNDRSIDFHLRIPERRKTAVQAFYATIQKKPSEVFPLRFAADQKLAVGLTSGNLDGLFYFPTDGSAFEIDRGESFLCEIAGAIAPDDASAPPIARRIQVSMIDQFRDHPRASLSRFFPPQPDRTIPYHPPAVIRFLAWMFLPPEHNRTRKRLTERFTQIALWCLRAK